MAAKRRKGAIHPQPAPTIVIKTRPATPRDLFREENKDAINAKIADMVDAEVTELPSGSDKGMKSKSKHAKMNLFQNLLKQDWDNADKGHWVKVAHDNLLGEGDMDPSDPDIQRYVRRILAPPTPTHHLRYSNRALHSEALVGLLQSLTGSGKGRVGDVLHMVLYAWRDEQNVIQSNT